MFETIVSAAESDWTAFLTLAASEGWRVPANEVDFHRRSRASTALALRRGAETVGFVTVVAHASSGWIGNLLIAPAMRGRGCGVRLFEQGVAELHSRGVNDLWLTASTQGAPLYARRGFVKVGEVQRWVRPQGGLGMASTRGAIDARVALQADFSAWGDRRDALLQHLGHGGEWRQGGESIALLQQSGREQIIGPWLAVPPTVEPCAVLDELIGIARPGRELILDAIARPESDRRLEVAGFVLRGGTDLMRCGGKETRLDSVLALATLGSCG